MAHELKPYFDQSFRIITGKGPVEIHISKTLWKPFKLHVHKSLFKLDFKVELGQLQLG